MDGREFKSFPIILTKEIEDRTVVGITAVTGNIDSYYDIIHRGAFKKTIQENGARVRHLWQHDFSQPPIAAIKELREVGRDDLPAEIRRRFPDATGGLLVARRYLETTRGDEVLQGIAAGAINEMSIGFNPVKWDYEELDADGDQKRLLVRNLREVRLWDTSDVNWGANPATTAWKSALPYQDTGVEAKDAGWQKPELSDFTDEAWEVLSEAERRRIAAHFAWANADPPERFEDLKLPHHRPSKTGVGPCVWNGVRAAFTALMVGDAEGIPASDRRVVHRHLAQHAGQFDEEAPAYELVELAWMVARVQRAGLHTPAWLGGAKLAEKMQELEALLRAEPLTGPSALTPGLVARLEIAKRLITEE